MADKGGRFQKKTMSQGVGESKIFAAPEGVFVDGLIELTDGSKVAMLDCHVAGVPLRDMPVEVQQKILFQQTDEGIKWWNENAHRLENREAVAPGASGRGMRLPSGREATDPVEKEIVHFRDDLQNDVPMDENHDPLRVAMERNLPHGHRGLWISEQKAAKEGLRRGVIDWQPVLVDGQKVKVGNMFLASVPAAVAERADRYYEKKAHDRMIEANDSVREQAEQIKPERDMRRRGADRDIFGGLQDDDPEVAASQVLGKGY
ncbi:MAG TPA: hypothetical protein VKX49_26250 [Bryobacteraceae bacterium]|nr:hypothetical protein [Bryobacteraceae bacterium]